MDVDAETNPYSAPESVGAVWVTPQGFTVGQCQQRFFAKGIVAAAVGGASIYFVDANGDVLKMLLLPGLVFGIALWVSIQDCIGLVSHGKKLLIVFGSLFAFATCGFIYGITLPAGGWYLVQPISLTTLKPCLLGPAGGATVLIGVLALTGQRLTKKRLFAGWCVLSVAGFVAMFASDEFGMRHRYMAEAASAGICGAIYIAIASAVIGWQMAAANSQLMDASSNREEAT